MPITPKPSPRLADAQHPAPGQPPVIEQRHLPALDGVRGLAIALVVLVHATALLRDVPGTRLLQYGWIGVDLFFVLSGFLITRILLETRETPRYFRRFYVRRGLRVWPLYFAYLAAALLLVHALAFLLRARLHGAAPGGPLAIVTPVWMYALLVQNLDPGSVFCYRDFMAVTWSLCIEEHFYLLWPLFVRRLTPRVLWAGLLAVMLLSPVARLLALTRLRGVPGDVWQQTIYRFTPFHLDSIAAGCLLCLVWSGMGPGLRTRRLFPTAFVVGLLATILCLRFEDNRVVACFAFSALAVVFFGLTGLALDGHGRRFWTLGPMRSLGRISYGLYLIHPTVFLFLSSHALLRAAGLGRHLILAECGSFVLATAISIGLAALSWRFYESRVLTLKSRFAP